MKPQWEMTVPVISTGHLTRKTVDRLTDRRLAIVAAPYDSGVFIYVPDGGALGALPDDLAKVCDWYNEEYDTCGKGDCWLRIDADGEQIDGLTYYEW